MKTNADSFSGIGGDTENVAYLIDDNGEINKVAGLVLIVVDPSDQKLAIYPLVAPAGLAANKGVTIDVNWNS